MTVPQTDARSMLSVMTVPSDNQDRWCVDVVLRALGSADSEDRVVDAVAKELAKQNAGEPGTVRSTYSYDAPPPDGSLGVSCWITAHSAGAAADAGVRLVCSAALTVTGHDHPLWDLRLLPSSAVTTRSEQPSGTLLRRAHS